jgi:hypothetical protein
MTAQELLGLQSSFLMKLLQRIFERNFSREDSPNSPHLTAQVFKHKDQITSLEPEPVDLLDQIKSFSFVLEFP